MRFHRVLAVSAVSLAFVAARAQDAFPDTPANHWAYEALTRMKQDGLLVGYPDGLFRGGRPASRYELAVAMHAVYTNLKNITDGLDAQIRATNAGGNTQAEVVALKDAVAELQRSLLAMKGYGDEIANLRRASDTFELELTSLGVDVQAMKDDLRDLAGRVKRLEDKKDPFDISGRVDIWMGGGHGLEGRYGLNRDGRIEGTGNKGPLFAFDPPVDGHVGITDDLAILHEAAVTIKSSNRDGIQFRATGVATNAFGQATSGGTPQSNIGFGNQSDLFNPANGAAGAPGVFGYAEGSGDLYLQELMASYSAKNFAVEGGRIRHRATSWILQRIDNTLYFDNDRWDDGLYTFDGLHVKSGVGPVAVELYGGRNASVNSVKGVRINPLRSGPVNGAFGSGNGNRLEAQRVLGGTITTSVKFLELRGDYLVLDADSPEFSSVGNFDHVDVYGGEASFRVGRFGVKGGLRQSSAYLNASRVDGLRDNAWDANVTWASGRFDLKGGYREVALNYMAPGDWGRLGILRNPTNIRGFIGNARYALSPRYTLSLDGEISQGLENDGAGSFFNRDTDIDRYAIRIDGKLARSLDAFLSYEETTIDGLVGTSVEGNPRYRWYSFGLAHSFSNKARMTVAYEQSALREDYQTSGGGAGNSFRGGFLTTQLTVKF